MRNLLWVPFYEFGRFPLASCDLLSGWICLDRVGSCFQCPPFIDYFRDSVMFFWDPFKSPTSSLMAFLMVLATMELASFTSQEHTNLNIWGLHSASLLYNTEESIPHQKMCNNDSRIVSLSISSAAVAGASSWTPQWPRPLWEGGGASHSRQLPQKMSGIPFPL